MGLVDGGGGVIEKVGKRAGGAEGNWKDGGKGREGRGG